MRAYIQHRHYRGFVLAYNEQHCALQVAFSCLAATHVRAACGGWPDLSWIPSTVSLLWRLYDDISWFAEVRGRYGMRYTVDAYVAVILLMATKKRMPLGAGWRSVWRGVGRCRGAASLQTPRPSLYAHLVRVAHK